MQQTIEVHRNPERKKLKAASIQKIAVRGEANRSHNKSQQAKTTYIHSYEEQKQIRSSSKSKYTMTLTKRKTKATRLVKTWKQEKEEKKEEGGGRGRPKPGGLRKRRKMDEIWSGRAKG